MVYSSQLKFCRFDTKNSTVLKYLFPIQNIFLLFLISCCNYCFGQLYYKGKNITTENGLSDNRVTCFFKDKTGYLWIGTKNGLNRYDGHTFKIFKPGKENSISNETINDIVGDINGNIWVATMAGLNCYNPQTNKWSVLLPALKKTNNGIPNLLVWDLWVDKNGLLWIASDVFEFCNYDVTHKKFTYYNWPQFVQNELVKTGKKGYYSIQRFTKKNEHEFWLGTSKGLVSLDINTHVFKFLGGGYSADVNDIKYDKSTKQVYLSVQGGLLFVYNEVSNLYSSIELKPEPYPSTKFTKEQNDDIWMAGEKGLIKINQVKNTAVVTESVPITGSLLPGGTTSVYIDNTGIRWIGTPNGISSIDYTNISSVFLPLIPASDKDGVNNITSVFYDSIDNKYFVCSNKPAAVFIIDINSGDISKIVKDKLGNPFTGCNTIYQDASKNIWLLTRNNVYQYVSTKNSFSRFTMPNNDSTVVFRDMVEDAEGNYWFASFHKGIYFYNTAKKEFTQLNDSLNKFLQSSVSSLYADNKHKEVWIGSFGFGLFNYNLVTKKHTWYAEVSENTSEYASLLLVDDICGDAKGNVWIATNTSGFMRYNRGQPYEKSFSHFDMRSGLVTNNIISSIANNDTLIWFLSGTGLHAINVNGQQIGNNNYNQLFKFSIYVNDFSIPHNIFFDQRRNEVLMGTGGGLLIYHPYNRKKIDDFPLVFTSMIIDSVTKNFATTDTYKNLILPYNTKSIIIKFAGLHYGMADDVSYEYKLNGYDDKWLEAGNSFEINYQNLSTGKYSFSIRAVGRNKEIITTLSGLTFTITPRFWQNWWFIAIIGVSIIGVLYWIIRTLLQKLKEESQLNAFATSLYGQTTTDDIFWDTANNCITLLGFIDCVIYEKDENRNVLIQKAAAGPKKPGEKRQIINHMEIPTDQGIVGYVCTTGKSQMIGDSSKDPRYIVDDEIRLSEISVPVFVEGKVFAVIDSEHPQKNFFTQRHLRLLKKIAAICSERITKYLSEERLRTKIARDLHDEMGSILTSINVLSKVAMQTGFVNDEVKNYLQKIKDNSANMMESMSDIVWAINPLNDSIEKILLHMKEFAAEMLEPARINYYFKEEGKLDKSLLNLEQRKDLYMIFKEAINNAVKYSNATEISISIIVDENIMQLQITDNGKGFDSTKINHGNGLNNMHSRAMTMNATLRIKSILNTGTTILLTKNIT